MGAIASGMVRVLNRDVLAHVPNPAATLEDVTAREDREMGRRERQYRDSRIAQDLEHKIVILTDDGLATGATMRAAVMSLRQRKIARCSRPYLCVSYLRDRPDPLRAPHRRLHRLRLTSSISRLAPTH